MSGRIRNVLFWLEGKSKLLPSRSDEPLPFVYFLSSILGVDPLRTYTRLAPTSSSSCLENNQVYAPHSFVTLS